MRLLVVVTALLEAARSDVYLHNPRGSNDRLNEQSAARNNANRLFNSQNNNRGGYNVGDATAAAANGETQQYQMKYFQSGQGFQTGASNRSYLTIEWTMQHGCGGNDATDPQKTNCQLVLQYMCQPNSAPGSSLDRLRDGTTTATQQFTNPQAGSLATETQGTLANRKAGDVRQDRGLQETWDWYNYCYIRERNKGLFTADQVLTTANNLGYSSAIYTRQNPNGNQNGYECPEERDYYPYWHPTPWDDIAVLTDNVSMCQFYQSNSFNVRPYHQCVEFFAGSTTPPRKTYSRYNNKTGCEANGGTWTAFYNFLEYAPEYTTQQQCLNAQTKGGLPLFWALPSDSVDMQPKCLVQLPVPDCQQAPWSRSNHNGNGLFGVMTNYTWTLPFYPSGTEQRCAFRLRYNISTDDYDPWNTTASSNQNAQGAGSTSPVQQNPFVEIGAGSSPLRLAINTAQYGRTFQDRSHAFILRPRPAALSGTTLYNLNVRGKRGNIVQTYPAVEYDFHPNTLVLNSTDAVHVQWTGSNTHNNGDPGGDGQTGDAGEGTTGTDRSNLVQINQRDQNFPTPFEFSDLWNNSKVLWIYHGKINVSPKDLATDMASAGYYRCFLQSTCPDPTFSAAVGGSTAQLNAQLNNAAASYEGAVLQIKSGAYDYMCTRNNNFSNRSQKGTIVVN